MCSAPPQFPSEGAVEPVAADPAPPSPSFCPGGFDVSHREDAETSKVKGGSGGGGVEAVRISLWPSPSRHLASFVQFSHQLLHLFA